MARGLRHSLLVWERIFFRVLLGILCLLILAGTWLSRIGVPKWMADALMRRIDTGAFAVEARTIRISPLKGVRLGRAAVYRRGVVGPAVLEAAEVILGVDPLAVLRGVGTLQRIEIHGGELRPELAFGLADRPEHDHVGRLEVDLVLDHCRVQEMMVEDFQARLRLLDVTARIDNIRMSLARDGMRGSASGNVEYSVATGRLTGHATLVMNPHIALPLLEEWGLHNLALLFRRFEFGESLPECALDFEAGTEAGAPMTVKGSVHLHDARYRGVAALQADAVMHVESQGSNTVVRLDPLSLERRDGSACGLVVIDLHKETVTFDAQSTLNPNLLRQALGILRDPFWDRWSYDGPVTVDARGTAGYESMAGTDFTATIEASRVRYKDHPLDPCSFRMRMTDWTNMLSAVQVGLYGGEATGAARFILPSAATSNTAFEVAVKLNDLDFERVAARLIGDGDREYNGRLSGELALRGVMGTNSVGTVRGNGLVNIDDGRVFMLPLFGGLSDIMTRLIPGLDFVLRQSDAFAEFRVADSRVTSDKVKIEGSVLSLSGAGYCGFDQNMDFHVQVKLMKDNNMVARLVRVVTFPISKLFEFRLRGTFEEPRWYPENFSTDLLEKVGLRKGEP